MRPKKNQTLLLKSVVLRDPLKDRELTFQVNESKWEAFKASSSFVKRVQLASKVFDNAGTELKNEYKGIKTINYQFTIENVGSL